MLNLKKEPASASSSVPAPAVAPDAVEAATTIAKTATPTTVAPAVAAQEFSTVKGEEDSRLTAAQIMLGLDAGI